MKWIIGTALVGGTAAALLVPKGDDDRWSRWPGDMRADSLYRESMIARSRYTVVRRVVQRGEARERARAVDTARGEALTFQLDARLGVGTTAVVRQRVADELRGAGVETPRYPIAVVAQLDTSLLGGIYTQAVVLPERAGEPCTVVLNLPNSQRNKFQPSATQRLLGTCAFHASYGAPGAGTTRWLLETRGVAARYLKTPSAYAGDTSRIRLGVSYFGWDDLSEALLRCRIGIADGCDRFVGPDTYLATGFLDLVTAAEVDRSPLGTEFPGVEVHNSTTWSPDGPRLRAGVLSALVAELGTERFGALWRDERGLQEAYAMSAGRPFSSWVANYVAARTGPYVAGPGIPALQIALALAIVIATVTLAVTRSPRQLS